MTAATVQNAFAKARASARVGSTVRSICLSCMCGEYSLERRHKCVTRLEHENFMSLKMSVTSWLRAPKTIAVEEPASSGSDDTEDAARLVRLTRLETSIRKLQKYGTSYASSGPVLPPSAFQPTSSTRAISRAMTGGGKHIATGGAGGTSTWPP